MDFNNEHNDLSMIADSSRPPQHNARNNESGYNQTYSGDDSNAAADAHHQHAQALLRSIVHEQSMMRDDISNDDRSSSDGDEGLEDHQREGHIDAADLGHFHVNEMRRLIAHHHHCDCPICPHRITASVNEWLMDAAIDPETPGSMYPEQGSGDLSMASSMFLETRPQTPGLLAEMGSWPTPTESVSAQCYDSYEYMTSPLWLAPERMVPHQLDTCIPEESEPSSDHEC